MRVRRGRIEGLGCRGDLGGDGGGDAGEGGDGGEGEPGGHADECGLGEGDDEEGIVSMGETLRRDECVEEFQGGVLRGADSPLRESDLGGAAGGGEPDNVRRDPGEATPAASIQGRAAAGEDEAVGVGDSPHGGSVHEPEEEEDLAGELRHAGGGREGVRRGRVLVEGRPGVGEFQFPRLAGVSPRAGAQQRHSR